MRVRSVLVPALAVVPVACADAPGPGGPAIAIDVAALNLTGVGDVVWDLQVDNGDGDVVWQRRVTSAGYGDGAGSASYIGPCDADPDVNENTVKVWVVGVYDGAILGADAGSFSSGSDAGAGAVNGTEIPFQNPTDGGPLTRDVTCAENTDVAVQFDVALMRPAQQGFFDIAVDFNNIFCSAKLDCCDDADSNGCDVGGAEDIDLLFDASGQRARTFVLGFACTAGAATGVDTELYMDDLALDCTSPASGFSADITVDPAPVADGNACTAGADGMSTCAAVTELAAVDADGALFQVAVFRGTEALTSGGVSAQKRYWNVALGVNAGISACHLRTRATADDAANTDDGVDGGEIDAGVVYPYVTWDVDLATCASEPLTFDDPTASVTTAYTATGGDAETFAHTFAGTLPTAPDGSTEALAAASCDALHTDYPALTSGSYWIDPDGAGTGVDAFFGHCWMAGDGGWTLVLRGGGDVPTEPTWHTTAALNVDPGATDGTQGGATFKLSDATINAFDGVYRVITAGSYSHTRFLDGSCVYDHVSNPSADCRRTCADVDLTSCVQGGATIYGFGIHGGEGTAGNGCGMQYFSTSVDPGYMSGPASTYNMYWVVQTTGAGADNATCAYGPGQRWQDNGDVNADSTITVWRR